MQAEAALRATLDAIAAADAAAASRLFAPAGRLELPLLGQTLVGRDPIARGLERLIGASRARCFQLAHVHATSATAIAEGRFEAEGPDGARDARPMALVLDLSEQGIARLSVYLDTYGRRLWSEGLIAEPHPAGAGGARPGQLARALARRSAPPSEQLDGAPGAAGERRPVERPKEPPDERRAVPSERSGAEALLRAYCAAFGRRELAALVALFAEDAVFDLPLEPERLEGRAAIERLLKGALLGLDEIAIDLERVLERGERVLAEGVFGARIVGAPAYLDGAPARLDFRFTVACETRAGVIVRWSEYFDTRPLRPRERARLYPITRRSPYWEGTERAGVQDFMVYNHTYFPLSYRSAPAEDYIALTERVTLWDVACERQTELRGRDAAALVDRLTTRAMRDLPVGGCRYTLVCDPEGRIICDPVLLHPWPEVYWLSHGDVDLTLWARGLALGAGLEVTVREPDVAPLQIQGPLALEVLKPLVEGPIETLGYYKCCVTRVAGIEAVVSRTGWSGGLGYEVFPLDSSRAMTVWDALVAAGRPHGLRVTGPNVHRAVEKNVTDTSYYSNSDLNPFESGQERLVDLDKGEFIGRGALERVAREGARRRSVGLKAAAPLPLLEWYWPIEHAGRRVGEVRWACHSFALGIPIAIGVIERTLAEDAALTIVHSAGRTAASIVELPFV